MYIFTLVKTTLWSRSHDCFHFKEEEIQIREAKFLPRVVEVVDLKSRAHVLLCGGCDCQRPKWTPDASGRPSCGAATGGEETSCCPIPESAFERYARQWILLSKLSHCELNVFFSPQTEQNQVQSLVPGSRSLH